VLGPERRPVFAQEGIPTATPTEVVTIGGNLTQRLVLASIQAMPRMRGHEAEAFELLSRLVRSGSTRYAAIDAIRQLPEASWPPTGVSALGDDLVAYLRGVAPGNRTGAAFRQAVDFGRHLAARLPTSDGQRLSASLDQLVVRTIRIEAVRAQMKFDVSRITLQAGEDVEIEFVNADEMPHNLLITSPGAMETVALKAEAMVQDPAAFSKHFVPESKDVLFWTPLVAPGETIRRRFTAPARPDGYPFVCTFPGHWRTMNGTVEVTRAVPAPSAP
jgi:azurin